jgi:hypothetical protein
MSFRIRWPGLVAGAVFIVATLVHPLQAQTYPFPGKVGSPPVLCTTCAKPKKNLPTAAYKAPLDYVGRYVDSQTTLSVQNVGMRTVRARDIDSNADTGRICIGLGEAVGCYKLDRFFTKLTAPMVPCSVIGCKTAHGRNPLEKIVKPDSFFYAEAGQSAWAVTLVDAQVVMGDFDLDDRGFVYVGTKLFGWGVEKDTGGPGHMAFVSQNVEDTVVGESVISLKTGGKYYVVISDGARAGAATLIRDVTVPATPLPIATRTGVQHGILAWSKFNGGSRLAVLSSDGKVRIYDYAAYVGSGIARETIDPPPTKNFTDVSFDESGTLWVTESGAAGTSSSLWRISPSITAVSGYVREALDVYGTTFSPDMLAVGGGFIAVAGRQKIGTVNAMDVRLFRVGTGTPTAVDTAGFFRDYYYKAPAGLAGPGPYMGLQDLAIITQGGKRYLLHSAMGLGDVFEITGG